MIEFNAFTTPYDKIYFIYPSAKDCLSDNEQKFIERLKKFSHVEILTEAPATTEEVLDLLLHPNDQILLICDDMQNELFKSPVIDEIYRRLANHGNVSILSIIQSGFMKNEPYYNSIWRNCNFLLIFNNPADGYYLNNLGRKLFGPKGGQYLCSAMKTAQEIMGMRCYVAMDAGITKKSSPMFPLRTLILPDDQASIKNAIIFKH